MEKTKKSVVVVYTGDGKGKTSAAIGLAVRALGAGQRVAFVQFIKQWQVSEHKFFEKYLKNQPNFTFYKGGRGFYHAGKDSAENVSDDEHLTAARRTLEFAVLAAISGDYDVVIADEINNAVTDGLLSVDDMRKLIAERHPSTSLCLTGRNFPTELVERADIVTDMAKINHHFDDGFVAKEGIDF
jgi:cob(I)alamin adenosyltransferase